MALLPGGGYSEYVTVHKNHLMYINDNKNLSEYCAIPEAMLTSLMLLDKSIKFEK
jgi:NADPH:quinone reductase-like Zn-dependent oxidoreductase